MRVNEVTAMYKELTQEWQDAQTEAIREAVAAEREACAKLAETFFPDNRYTTLVNSAGEFIARAIRERGNEND